MKSKEEITKDYEKIINFVIKKMKLGYRHDEIFDIGMIGFVNGLNTFDESKGYTIVTYLYRCIKNEICKYLYLQNMPKRTGEVISYNTMISEDTELLEVLGYDIDYEQNYYVNEMLKEIFNRLSKLTKKQQLIFNHLYGLNGYKEMSARQIEDKYGFSRQSIHQIKKRVLNQLRFILQKYQNEERKYDKEDWQI